MMWVVIGVAAIGTVILVYNALTGKLGVIRDPSVDEYEEAHKVTLGTKEDYEWQGGDDRVDTDV